MPRFTLDNTFGYEPAGVKLLNKVFDKVVDEVRSRSHGGESATDIEARNDKIAQAVLDVCYEDHGNIDIGDLTRQALARLGFEGGAKRGPE